MVIIDEAHTLLKSKNSEIAKVLGPLRTKRRITLSGTPFVNNLKGKSCVSTYSPPLLVPDAKHCSTLQNTSNWQIGVDPEHLVPPHNLIRNTYSKSWMVLHRTQPQSRSPSRFAHQKSSSTQRLHSCNDGASPFSQGISPHARQLSFTSDHRSYSQACTGASISLQGSFSVKISSRS